MRRLNCAPVWLVSSLEAAAGSATTMAQSQIRGFQAYENQ